MSRQKRGLDYEHKLAAGIFELSEGKIIPIRSGYSGNQSVPSPDLLIPFGGALAAVEAKTTSSDTSLIIEPEDIEDIAFWALRMSEVPTYPYLAIKFNRRVVYVTRLTRVSNTKKCFEKEVEKCPFDATVTKTGNLSFRKPDTDEWSSVKGADGPNGKKDAHMVLESLRDDQFEHPSVIEVLNQKEEYFEQFGDD